MITDPKPNPSPSPPPRGHRKNREHEIKPPESPELKGQELEESWRVRLNQARGCYQAATARYEKALQEEPDGISLAPEGSLAVARQQVSETLAEYMHVLGIFTDLTLYGGTPEEKPPATAAGAKTAQRVDVIAVVDDDASVRSATKTLLRSAGYTVETFASAESFLHSPALQEAECLILDVWMPGIDGLELQRRLRAAKIRVPIIFITAHDERRYLRQAFDGGAVDFLRKPFDGNALLAIVRTALDDKRSA